MNVKKFLCSLAAAAVAVSMMAVNAFATTIDLDSEYPGIVTFFYELCGIISKKKKL